MLAEQMLCLQEDILPRLREQGIDICPYSKLNSVEREKMHTHFLQNVFPVLTPQAVDISHPFPYVSNLSLNLGLFVKPDKKLDHGRLRHLYNESRFVRLKLPPNLSRLIPLNEEETKFALLGEVVSANIHYLFPNMQPKKSFLFRLTRDADLEIREDEAGDLLATDGKRTLSNPAIQFSRAFGSYGNDVG